MADEKGAGFVSGKGITTIDQADEEIKVDRQSICMADDVSAPNGDVIEVSEQDRLEDVMKKVANYLPKIRYVVWAVDSGKEAIAYIIVGKNPGDLGGGRFRRQVYEGEQYQYELCRKNQLFLEMKIKALHCSHFRSEKEGVTSLEKAKCCMKERFLERLKTDGGSLCIWGEWFGRPQEHFHVVESVRWGRDEIRIYFEEGESLFIQKPTKIINEEKRLVIGDAESVLWVWYAYGREHIYENLYVRQYTKNTDGMVRRAEGKRSDVRIGEGSLFYPMEEEAVWLGLN